MTRDELIRHLGSGDPIGVAHAVGITRPLHAHVHRGPAPADWLVDTDAEGDVAGHRAAHAAGRPSEAMVRYGAGTGPEAVADRLLALAALASDTGMLRVVRTQPGEGDAQRPGSWGVEDLVVVSVARAVLPAEVAVHPSWELLGAGACQVALAFGATGWRIPGDDPADPDHLAASLAATVVEE